MTQQAHIIIIQIVKMVLKIIFTATIHQSELQSFSSIAILAFKSIIVTDMKIILISSLSTLIGGMFLTFTPRILSVLKGLGNHGSTKIAGLNRRVELII